MRRPIAALALLACLASGPAGLADEQASPLPLGQGDSLVDFAFAACSEAPESAICLQADRLVRERMVESLLVLGGRGRRDEDRELVAAFLDHPLAEIRAAAVAALGNLHPDASDTPILARLLNDPVPAVRQAALAALQRSSDAATIPLVERARNDQGMSLVEDPPPDPGLLAMTLPPDAQPVRFTDDATDGVLAFVTDQSRAQVVYEATQRSGQPALTLEALRGALLPDWARAPGMAFYQGLSERMEGLATLPADQQLLAQVRLAQIMALAQQGSEPAEFARWHDTRAWGEVSAFVLAVDPLFAMPSQILLVYQDRQLGRTGLAIQWLPALSFPPALAPVARPAGQPATANDFNPVEVEATIWEAVQLSGTARDYEAYLAALPRGAHAEAARTALDALKAAAAPTPVPAPAPTPAVETPPATKTPGVAPPVATAESLSVTTDSGITLALAGPPLPQQPLVIAYSGLTASGRSPWLTVVPQGMPDSQWTDWSYTQGSDGTLTLRGQRAGAYEIRALLENPREVVARLAFTIASAASGPPALALVGEAVHAGQAITLRFSNLPGDGDDWIAVVEAGKPDTQWGAWSYTHGKSDGELTLPGQPAGSYELRAYVERPRREVMARLPLIVLP